MNSIREEKEKERGQEGRAKPEHLKTETKKTGERSRMFGHWGVTQREREKQYGGVTAAYWEIVVKI